MRGKFIAVSLFIRLQHAFENIIWNMNIIIIGIVFKEVANHMSEPLLFCEECFIFKMYRVGQELCRFFNL